MEQLYTKHRDGKPVAYAYGEEWVAMALYMDDISFDTKEEAKAWWDGYKRKFLHGYWIQKYDDFDNPIDFDCSVCNIPNDWESDYCPNCGAKMDGGMKK